MDNPEPQSDNQDESMEVDQSVEKAEQERLEFLFQIFSAIFLYRKFIVMKIEYSFTVTFLLQGLYPNLSTFGHFRYRGISK